MMFWMLGILFFFLIIDVIILACWEGKDPLHRALKQVRSQPEYRCFEVRSNYDNIVQSAAQGTGKLLKITFSKEVKTTISLVSTIWELSLVLVHI